MIGVIGVSYKTAALEIREKFALSEEEVDQFTRLLKIDVNLHGVVVLSTCNRFEIYFRIDKCCREKGFELMFRNLEYFKGYSEEYRKYFYTKQGSQAVEHLFKVVAGIDSLILGEDQVAKQVRDAFKRSIENDSIGSVLTRMFNKAFHAGKRVRTETAINKGFASVSSAAVALCEKELPNIARLKVLLVGTGQTGELALQNFTERGCTTVYITNRTFHKAEALAKKYRGIAFEIEKLESHLSDCDIVMVATSSKTHLITREMVLNSSARRSMRQIYFDLSVPRNISSGVGEIENVTLFAVDDLQTIVDESSVKRKEAVSEAMEIIQTVKLEFTDWLHSMNLTPVIHKIKTNFHEINKNELEGFLKVKSPENPELVNDYGKHISDKYARLFIRNLKTVTENGRKKEFVELVNELFEL